jgi:hypothetical protein
LLQSSVQTSILNRLGDVGGLDFFGGGEIGDGAADFEYPTVGAGAQAQFVLAPVPAILWRTIDRPALAAASRS